VYGNTYNAQIVYTGSDHGRISGNTVIDSGWGAIGVWNIVGTRPNTQIYQVTDTQVTNNTVQVPATAHEGVVAGLQDFASPLQPNIYSDPTNFYDFNSYQFPGASRSCWYWGETSNVYKPISWSAWQGAGQDLHGQVAINTPMLH
jgi:hypothetical protein